MRIEETARAKINLCLHVTSQRADGYHELDALVAFADVGDRIVVEAARDLELQIGGPFGGSVPDTGDNLVLKAARWLDPNLGAKITLTKMLPVAAGIGGGSADAAATIKALSQLWRVTSQENAASLGADVPACLLGQPCRMRGIGEELVNVEFPHKVPILLINPGIPVSTPDVFQALKNKQNPELNALPEQGASQADLIAYLAVQRNDLEAPAIEVAPEIEECLGALRAIEGARLVRMSGSGATCFGLFDTFEKAQAAAELVQNQHPNWWVMPSVLSS
jgi:4-diphosphocytidyl-2-C-methyl-D-erythritol kinase